MKKILFLLVMIASLSSCATPIIEQSIVVNYASFSGDEFELSPLEYSNRDFEVVGTIYEEFGLHRDIEFIIERAISDAKKIDANGLLKFEVMVRPNERTNTFYVVKGVAVKFKDVKKSGGD